MARGRLVSELERTVIRVIFQEMPGAKAEQIRQEASKRLSRALGLSTVQRELVALRKRRAVISQGGKNIELGLDSPWSIGAISLYPVRTEVVPSLVLTCTRYREATGGEFTVRQALWFDRLMGFIGPESSDREGGDLVIVAVRFAVWEQACEESGYAFPDTSVFDAPNISAIKRNTDRFFAVDKSQEAVKTDGTR